ncbi:MAG: hypothetical protein ABW321_00925 [Polyangiales bacterium]
MPADQPDENPVAPVAVPAPATFSATPSKRRRSRRRRYSSWQSSLTGELMASVLLGVLLIGSPQLLGGVLPWSIDVIAVLSIVCLAVVGLRAPVAGRRVSWLIIALLGVTLWTTLQALPLPCGLVRLVAPDSVAKLQAARKLLGDAVDGTCTVTQDLAGTRQEIVKSLCLFATFTSCWLFAASGGRRRLFWLIASSTLVMSVVAIAHAVLELDRVFGIYTAEGITRELLLAPLMNGNHLGAFAAIGVPLFIGLSYRDSNLNVRLVGYVALALTSGVALLSLSRGAIGQLFASGGIMVWLVLRQRGVRSRREGPPLRELAFAAAAAAGLGTGAYWVGRQVLSELGHADFSKLQLGLSALRFATKQPLVGVGRGAFGSAFVGFEGSLSRYRFAENFVAQWAADWGFPVTLGLLGLIGVALWRAIKAHHGSLARLGAYTALLAFAAQNVVDFGFEVLGVAVVACALLAGCVAPSAADATSGDAAPISPLRRASTWVQAGLVVCFALLVAFGPRLHAESVPVLQAQLRKALNAGDRDGFRQQLRAALELHASEPVVMLLAASESAAHDDPKTFGWLNRAMQLAPGWARPHQLAFRWLWQRGQGRQALIELKAAAAIDPNLTASDACRLGRVDASWALAAAPENAQRRAYFDLASSCIHPTSESEAFDDALLREYPGHRVALTHEAQRLVQSDQAEASLEVLERLRRLHPDYQPATVMKLETLLALGRTQELIDETDRTLAQLDPAHQIKVLGIKAFALARAGTPELALDALADIRRRSSADPEQLADSFELEGRLRWERHEVGEALSAFRQAYKINNDTKYLYEIATAAERIGDRAQALWAYINLCQRAPLGGGCERRNELLSALNGKQAR